MTRRLSILILFAPIIALMVIGIVRAARGEGSSPTAVASVHAMGRTFDGTVVQDGSAGARKVAIVSVAGVITSGDSSKGNVGGDTLVSELRAIDESGDYKGVILEMDTPGGGVLPSAEAAREVDTLRRHHIKVVSWMRDLAASGGYYISSQADRIVAAPDTLTGSIGVIFEYANLGGLAQKVGVKPVVIKSGKLKDIGSPYRDLTDQERSILQQMINEAYAHFVATVAKGRHMSEADVRRLADGRIYTGTQAKANGLVDDLGMREEAYDAMADLLGSTAGGDKLRVVQFDRRLTFVEQLTGAGAQGALSDTELLQLLRDVVGGKGHGAAGLGGARASGPGSDLAAGAAGDLPGGTGLSLQYRAVFG